MTVEMEGMLQKGDLPQTGKDWVTLDNGVEFLPGSDADTRVANVRKLWSGNQVGASSPYDSIFADGSETYYDEYAQAWRVLGWYIDCDFCNGDNGDGNDFCQGDRNRRLENGDGDEDAAPTGCPRFLLWAAYVDVDYEGNGGNEYSHFNRNTGRWNRRNCKSGARCVKMDCHMPDTNFKLIGFFKEPRYDEWMEQLINYQGDCMWNDSEYKLMHNISPMGLVNTCTKTTSRDEYSGRYLYYNLQPNEHATVTIGLYTEDTCTEVYKGSTAASTVLTKLISKYQDDNANGDDGNGDGSADEEVQIHSYALDLVESINSWNSAFAAFRTCQPCKAYDLTKSVAFTPRGDKTLNANGDRYPVEYVCDDDSGECEAVVDEDTFICSDEYNQINQCGMFRDNTDLMTGSFKDVELAGQQGSITSFSLHGFTYGQTEKMRATRQTRAVFAWMYLFASAALFGYAGAGLIKARRRAHEQQLAQPLMASDGEVA